MCMRRQAFEIAHGDKLFLKPEDRVREVFRRALIREPDADELTRSVEFLQGRKDNPAEAVSQLLWALVTGPEFITNH